MHTQPEAQKPRFDEIATLLRGDGEAIYAWNARWNTNRFALQIDVIIAGAGCYGAAMGWWRDPQQALFTAIKFPLIVLLTTMCNALINGMIPAQSFPGLKSAPVPAAWPSSAPVHLVMAFVVLVPVLILAALILMAWKRCRGKNRIEAKNFP